MLIDRGTIKAVREILDRFESVAMGNYKRVNKMKRDHFTLSHRGGPDDYIKVGQAQDTYDELNQQVRSIIRELSELSRDSVDMGTVIGDIAALDTMLQERVPDAYAANNGKLSPVALAAKVIAMLPVSESKTTKTKKKK
ncbi:hypothetical protein KAR91_13865 [Candidatus Pacearchaeota archaeon]|nr:hypothetical protein [Candidatus Pacearchaeota archaeon]